MADHSEFFRRYLPELRQRDIHYPRSLLTFREEGSERPFRVLVVRLSPFRDVMNSMTHNFLASQAQKAGAEVDYCFLPGKADRELMEKEGVPLLTGIFSCRDWRDFDLVLLTNAYTLEMVNLVPLMEASGVPIYSTGRTEAHPLFILGGANASAVQGFLKPTGDGGYDSFADGIFFGEGEGRTREMVKILKDLGRSASRQNRLKTLAREISGLWTPWSTGKVEKARCPASVSDLLTDYPVLNSDEALTARLQISFGCPFFCGFCFEGWDRKPYREVSSQDILKAARELKVRTGARNIDLYSFNFNTHQDIALLLSELNGLFMNVSFLSQRLDVLDRVPGLLELELAADKRSFTLGVEGISRRQRQYYQKGLEEASLSRILNRMVRSPIREIKLFYILSGQEDREDFREFRTFLDHLQQLRQGANPGLKVLFSFGFLVRMPRTPLAYGPLRLEEGDWQPLVEATKEAVESAGFDFRLAFDRTEYTFSQVLALGGYEVHGLLLQCARQGVWYDRQLSPQTGKLLEGWLDSSSWVESHGQEKPRDWKWPLEFLESGIPPGYLHDRYLKAKEFLGQPVLTDRQETCLGLDCLGCGACSPTQRSFLTGHDISHPGSQQIRRLSGEVSGRQKFLKTLVMIPIPEEWEGAGKSWVEAALRRRILLAVPEAVAVCFDVKEKLWLEPGKSLGGCLVSGWTLVEIAAPQPLLDSLAGQFTPWHRDIPEFRRAAWRLSLPLAGFPEAPGRFSRWLSERHLPHTLVKLPGIWEWKMASKALGKKEIAEARAVMGDREMIFTLSGGGKTDIRSFLAAFPGRGPEFRARIQVTEIS